MPPLHHFLIIFDHSAHELIESDDLGADAEAALAAYVECERKYRDRDGIEIVLIGADSIETIHKTHSHYFGTNDHDFFESVLA